MIKKTIIYDSWHPGAVHVWVTGVVLDAVVEEMVLSVWTVILRKTTVVETFVQVTNGQPVNSQVVDKQQLVGNSSAQPQRRD